MKHYFFFIAILFAVSSYAQEPLRVLMIGNSFSGNASKYLPALASNGHHAFLLERAEMGGCSLQRHWDSVEVNKVNPDKGKPYNGKSLIEILSANHFDIVSLQQYSLLSGNKSTYQPYARLLYALIKKYQPQARIVIHETWAYRADAKTFGQVQNGVPAKSQKEMYFALKDAYNTMANDLNSAIIPSGDAFYKVATDSRWGFKPDTSKAIYPNLPNQTNSLNMGYSWDANHKLLFDPNHANEAGCYLAGLVWYAFLFHENPDKLNFKPGSVSLEMAAYLKKIAWQSTNPLH